ncbi:virulence factor TspB C-terminal domain-related protein [Nitrosomonas sp. Is24]|uniref:virulence factor TspB C-terminal domain-related protein n=1 Tax=Nitrosomonas sp. Is24 TaxID=3080533 RepID=UPI00294AF631|nr:virulence factor TspB C-terminal domain-related protein [Nitrosomonas sp. Is24]MDV6342939.1 virulence factor TspB C-terminal domain-related protein [Nitrosomonas sp. Is24]
MAHLHRIIAIFCFLYPSITFATLGNGVGEVNLAGWIKQTDGTYAKAFTNADGTGSKVTLTSAPKGITTTSTALVQTSKGAIGMDIEKTVNVATSRLGPTVAAFAKKAGPLGMALTAASLVCDLTNICNQAGQWVFNNPYSDPTYFPSSTAVGFYIAGGRNGTQSASLAQSCKLLAGLDLAGSTTTLEGSTCHEYAPAGYLWRNVGVYWVNSGACPTHYTLSGSSCVLSESSGSGAPTASDWDSAATKLNDDRFTPHLIDAGESVPTDAVPTLTADQKRNLGVDVEPTKDASGNVTGRKETTTSVEVVDNGTADKPGSVIVKETKTTITYNNSNTVIDSTSSTSYQNQPDTKQPSGFTISFDTVPEAKLETYNVPNTFGTTSWGSGSCPPDIDVPISKMTIHIPTQPVCDTALMIQPFVLLLSSLIGIYIIAGVRGGSAT